jgi:hypothetical protein
MALIGLAFRYHLPVRELPLLRLPPPLLLPPLDAGGL